MYVVCSLTTGCVVYVGRAFSPSDACMRSTKDVYPEGQLGPFYRSNIAAPRDDERSWLELSVHDVSQSDIKYNIALDDPALRDLLTDENFLGTFVAEEY